VPSIEGGAGGSGVGGFGTGGLGFGGFGGAGLRMPETELEKAAAQAVDEMPPETATSKAAKKTAFICL
jgi:hypothetical protein